MRNPSGSKVCVCVSFDPDVAQKLKDDSLATEVPMARLVNRALRKMYKLDKRMPAERQPA